MLIKVKTVTNRDLELTTIEPNNTVDQLKEAIEASEGIPKVQQRLIFNGKPLADEATIEGSGITAGVIVHMVLALRAGKKESAKKKSSPHKKRPAAATTEEEEVEEETTTQETAPAESATSESALATATAPPAPATPAPAPAVDPFKVEYEGIPIGYETDSFAVRKYRINEMSTVRRGIDDNICEFLENDLGFVPDHSYEDARMWVMALSLAIGIYAHMHDVPFHEAHSLTLGLIFAYYFCVAVVFFIGNYLEGNNVLVSKSRLKSVPHPKDRNAFQGNWVLKLLRMHIVAVLGFVFSLVSWALPASLRHKVTGNKLDTEVQLKHKLRIRSDAYMFSPKYGITVELVSPSMTFLTKPKVFHSVTEEWSIGEFFDKDGYIYPPALKKKINKLLQQLTEKSKK